MKKGFTLIELLAVIVILAIISAIAIPIVIKVINDVKVNSLKISMSNIEKAVELYINRNPMSENKVFTCSNGVCIDDDNKKLELSGNIIESGSINITPSGTITYNKLILDGYLCDKYNKEFVCNKVSKNIEETKEESIIIKNSSTSLNNYKIYGNSIPETYQQVEYIESTGTQYIDTDYSPNSNTNVIYDFEYLSGNANKYIPILGERVTLEQNLFSLWVNSSNYNVAINFDKIDTSGISGTNGLGRHVYSNDGSKFYLDNKLIVEIESSEFKSNHTISIFGLNTGSSTENRGLNGRVYYLKIYENNILVRNFVPCYRKSDNVIGMYELVKGKFFVNNGTETFLKGNDTPSPAAPIEVESVGDKTNNLLDIEKGLNAVFTTDGNGIYTITKTDTNRFSKSIPISLKAGTTYVMSYELIDTNSTYKFPLQISWNSGNSGISSGSTYRTFTPTTDASSIMIYQESKMLVGTYTTFKNLKIEEGSSNTEYEPYGYRIPVKTRGKNLFDIFPESWTAQNEHNNGAWGWYEKNGQIFASDSKGLEMIKSLENKTVTYSAYIDNTYGVNTSRVSVWVQYDDDSYPILGRGGNNIEVGNTGVSFVIIDFSKLDINRIKVINFGVTLSAKGEGYKVTTSKGMVELGTTRTEYEPYKEIKANIYLDEPLRKVGDYADYIDYKNQKEIRNVGVLNLNSEDNFELRDNYFALKLEKYPKNDQELSISNYLKYENNFWFEKDTLNIKITGINSVEELKEWLRDKNVEIYYPLNKSVVSDIELPKININNDYSNIIIETDITPGKMLIEYN